MIAVTCSACHLRFEAPAVERRLRGATITCPACDAGEPIVLDPGREQREQETVALAKQVQNALDERMAREGEHPAGKPARKKVTPPPLDLSRGLAHMRPTPPEIIDALEAQAAEDDAPLPVYVDFDRPDETRGDAPARMAGFGLAFTGVALAAVALAGPVLSVTQGTALGERAQRFVASFAPLEAPEDPITTAAIAPLRALPPRPVIARVVTELAETDEGRVLSVRTDLRNEADGAVAAPALRVSVRGTDGTVLHRWTQRFEGTIEAGETRAFTATTRRIPAGAGDVKVDFASR